MSSTSEIVPDRSSPEHVVSANQHSIEELTQATDTVTVTEDTPAPRRTRPSRACTVRAQQRLQEQQAAERKFKQPKKEQKRHPRLREEVEDEEDVDDREEEDGDVSPMNEQQCGGGSAAKIVTSLVQPPEPSQLPRRSLRSMWELASLFNFLHIFRSILSIKVEFSAEELETALLNPNDTLSDVHIPLLKAIPPTARMALTRDTWVTVLCRKLRAWWHWVAEGDLPIVASHGLEIEVYKSLDPGIRVMILKALCDIRVEQEDIRSYIESSLKSGVYLSTFRKNRVGGDSHGVNFWYEDDSLIGHRLYREIRKAELGKVKTKGSKVLPNVTYHWETVATNFDEFQDVSEKLFTSNSRTEASLGRKLKNDMLLEIEKEHKRKEKLLKKQHRQALLLDNFLDVDGYGAGRSRRDRKPVTYTFDDYDRSINEAIKITKNKPPCPSPSPEPSLHGRESDRLEASANGGWTSSTHPSEPVNNTSSVRSSEFADDNANEERAESVDRSYRRRQRRQRYSTMGFVEAVSDNEVDFGSDDDIVGEAVYNDEYLKKRKQRKDLSSASEGDEEYRWEEDNANEEEEEEDSRSTSEEDSDEPHRFKKLPRRETKSRSRSNHPPSGLRRSKRATRVNYQLYELSESDTEATRPAKSRKLVERYEPSDETEHDDFSMASQESEENANDPEAKNDEEEEPAEENDKGETNHRENDQLFNKPNGTEQEVEAVGKRRYLDLNELAPFSGFDDGPNTVLKGDNDNTDNS